MLRARHHTRALDTLDALREHDTRQDRVWAETLPVSATFWRPAQGSSYGPELHIDALAMMLFTHGLAAGESEAAVPGCCYVDAGGEDRVEVGITDADGAVLEAKGAEGEPGDRAGLADAAVELPSGAAVCSQRWAAGCVA